jgi:pimeloyl-ACP methyl ester carboxylesterase
MTDDPAFVLVHGAWHGGWCYRRTADLLRAKGHRVFTPTLTGLGERSHLFSGQINLTTHISDILNLIRWELLDKVVLLGHSYGGMVITGVADRAADKIASLVYLDAVIPSDNQSLYDLVPPEMLQNQLKSASDHGGVGVPPISAAFFNVNEKDRALVDALCTLQPIGCMNERLKFTGNGIAPVRSKVYVLAEGWGTGPGFRRYYNMVKDDKAWMTHALPCGHDVMLDMPEALAEILLKIPV